MERYSASARTGYAVKTIDSMEPGEDLMQSAVCIEPMQGMLRILRMNGLRCRKNDFYKAGGRQGREIKAYKEGKEFAVAYVGNFEYEILRIR